MITMKPKDFQDLVYENADRDYGMCPPPIDAQTGLNILINHFLGEDWYTTMPMGVQQVNAEAIYAILEKYPEKQKGLLSKIFK
jgi:hypothetical protein